jgi:hypothetical protein
LAEQTPEFAEYRAANADGARICLEVQEKLDDLTASGESLDDVPWISGLDLVVKAALGCGEIETGCMGRFTVSVITVGTRR